VKLLEKYKLKFFVCLIIHFFSPEIEGRYILGLSSAYSFILFNRSYIYSSAIIYMRFFVTGYNHIHQQNGTVSKNQSNISMLTTRYCDMIVFCKEIHTRVGA